MSPLHPKLLRQKYILVKKNESSKTKADKLGEAPSSKVLQKNKLQNKKNSELGKSYKNADGKVIQDTLKKSKKNCAQEKYCARYMQ